MRLHFLKSSFHSATGTVFTHSLKLWIWLSIPSDTCSLNFSNYCPQTISFSLATLHLASYRRHLFASAFAATTVFLKDLLSRHLLPLLSTCANINLFFFFKLARFRSILSVAWILMFSSMLCEKSL